MNKKNLLLSLVLLLTNYVFSQPILSSADLTPTIGDDFLIHYCDSVNEGPSGINQTWNFSSAFCPGYFQLKTISSAGSSLPTASFVQLVGNDSSFFYNASSSIEFIANSDGNSGYSTLLDTFKQMEFPITYGSSMTDIYKYNPYTILSITHYKSGRYSYVADGYGTILLPTGTYSDVLRIKQTEIRKDSVSGFVNNDSIVSFSWIKANNHMAIAWVTRAYSIGATSPYYVDWFYLDKVITSINAEVPNHENIVSLSPNPASKRIQLTISQNVDIKEIKMYNIVGKEIPVEINKISNEKILISPCSILNGIFYVRIIDRKGNIYKKKIQFTN